MEHRLSQVLLVTCTVTWNDFFWLMKLHVWNLLQNNIHPFLLIFCFLSSSVILDATEWGPNFFIFSSLFSSFARRHVFLELLAHTRTPKIWTPIKCLFSLLNSIFVQRNRKVKLWKSLSPGHAPGETCTLKEEQAHSRASSRSKCQSGKLQGGSEGGKLRRTTLLLTSNKL